jgi:hypothetical protein
MAEMFDFEKARRNRAPEERKQPEKPAEVVPIADHLELSLRDRHFQELREFFAKKNSDVPLDPMPTMYRILRGIDRATTISSAADKAQRVMTSALGSSSDDMLYSVIETIYTSGRESWPQSAGQFAAIEQELARRKGLPSPEGAK